jgi:hypothetical protein
MVLLDFTSSIPEEKAINLWQKAWQNAGIQQTLNRINSFGAQAVDEWLDHNIRSDALLLILSWHYAPINTRDSAEAICGVLFGNRLTQETLPSLAILHRPESGEGADEDLRYAITQALDWGPVKSSEIQHLWLSGVEDEMDNYATLIKAIADSDLKTYLKRQALTILTIILAIRKDRSLVSYCCCHTVDAATAGASFINLSRTAEWEVLEYGCIPYSTR